MFENRKLKRRELIYNLKVIDAETNEPLGRAVDINSDGLKLLSYKKLELETHLTLVVELPIEVFGIRKVTCTTRVRWSRKDLNPDYFAAGIQFIDISAEDTEALIAVMAQCSLA